MINKIASFGDVAVASKIKRMRKSNVLAQIYTLIDWDRIQKILSSIDFRNSSHFGRDNYDPLSMFKVLFLQSLYNFSDRDIEEQMNFHILFMHFCGFSIDSNIPDHSTIARWRDRFIEKNIYELCFIEINNQLDAKGLEIKSAVIVDASIVASKSRPRKKVIVEVEPTGDEVLEEPHISEIDAKPTNVIVYEEESKDPDARWLKKGKKSYYGYKEHVSTNKKGIINALITTPANVSDTKVFPELLEKVAPAAFTEVYGDKAYSSKKNSDLLDSKRLKDYIMIKHKSRSVKDETIINLNKSISKVRYVVERTFGCIKQNLGGSRSRYDGLVKTHNFNLLKAIAHNLVRASNHVGAELCLN
jgi:IS5 family transposase